MESVYAGAKNASVRGRDALLTARAIATNQLLNRCSSRSFAVSRCNGQIERSGICSQGAVDRRKPLPEKGSGPDDSRGQRVPSASRLGKGISPQFASLDMLA